MIRFLVYDLIFGFINSIVRFDAQTDTKDAASIKTSPRHALFKIALICEFSYLYCTWFDGVFSVTVPFICTSAEISFDRQRIPPSPHFWKHSWV